MDHISKALERTRAERSQARQSGASPSVRNWVRPSPAATRRESPVLGEIQKVALDPEHLEAKYIMGSNNDDPIMLDRFRLLRTRLTQMMVPNSWHSVGITSAGPKDGKTMTGINLAFSLARDASNRVFLVDADLRKPSVAPTLGLEPELGTVDYLTGRAELGQTLVTAEHEPNLIILPGRPADPGVTVPELMNSPRMSELFLQLLDIDPNAIIVVDFPPILVGDDVLALAPKLDATLLVIAEGQTDVDELTTSAELLSEFNLLGTVLNKSTDKVKVSEGYYDYSDRN